MTRAILLAGSLALATTTPVALPSPAQAQETGVVEVCRTEILPQFPEASLGDCVAFNQTLSNAPRNGYPAHECDAFELLDPDLFYATYDSYSECIRDYPHGKR
jgi:hypothetical protein